MFGDFMPKLQKHPNVVKVMIALKKWHQKSHDSLNFT